MNKENLDLASMAIETAARAGASASSVRITSARNVEVGYRQRKPETIKESSSRDLTVALYVDGRYSAQGTSDLRPDALHRFITEAVATTRLIAADPFRSLPDPKYFADREKRDLGLLDSSYGKWKAADRHAAAKAAEAASLEAGGEKVVSVSCRSQDGLEEEVLLASNGFQGSSAATYYVTYAQVTMQDEGDRRPMGYDVAVSVDRRKMPRPEAVGAGAVARTRALLGGRKIKTETLPIIVENRNVPRILAGLVGAMSGRAVQQKQFFLAGKQGQKIGSDALTLIDDPFVVGGLGSRLYDGDGITAVRRTLIESGVLREFFVDWYYSRKLGCEPTTGGPSNLIIPPGKRSVPAIMKDLGRGIWITDFIGGNNNTTTGDASVGILGQLFENGVPVQAVSEMNIAGNALEFWPKLIEVADDPWIHSSQRTPSLVFRDVVVSGI